MKLSFLVSSVLGSLLKGVAGNSATIKLLLRRTLVRPDL